MKGLKCLHLNERGEKEEKFFWREGFNEEDDAVV